MDDRPGWAGGNGRALAPERGGPPGRDGGARQQLLASEAAFAAWVAVALLAIGLGLATAKYAQAWARGSFHPVALLGSGAVLAGAALALLAAGRHLQLSALLAASGRPGTVVGLAAGLVVILAGAALATIWAAGWELPPAPAG